MLYMWLSDLFESLALDQIDDPPETRLNIRRQSAQFGGHDLVERFDDSHFDFIAKSLCDVIPNLFRNTTMNALTNAELVDYMRGHTLAVVATLGPDGSPQAALVGVGVTDNLEVIFDTSPHFGAALTLQLQYANIPLRLNPCGWVGRAGRVGWRMRRDDDLGELSENALKSARNTSNPG